MSAMFQSTRPRGARPEPSYDYFTDFWVSIHAPARGATRLAPPRFRRFGVSIHAPARGATIRSFLRRQIQKFQSTRPRGARLKKSEKWADQNGFNPRARAGRDPAGASGGRDEQVSIHAPARGATPQGHRVAGTSRFQSTRPRGARQWSLGAVVWLVRFQSTRPRGARLRLPHGLRFRTVFQSTRPRGARQHPHDFAVYATSFNPRARAGRDI